MVTMIQTPRLRIGVDDIATQTRKCTGFTVIGILEHLLGDFESKAKALLDRHKLASFHANEFDAGNPAPFLEFLQLIHSTLEAHALCFAQCTLLADSLAAEFSKANTRCLRSALNNASVPEAQALSILSPFMTPLRMVARSAAKLDADATISVDLADSSDIRGLQTHVMALNGTPVRAGTILTGIYSGLRQGVYTKAPALDLAGIRTVSAGDSVLVQAADVIGNLAIANLFVHLGSTTRGRLEKSRIVKEVFGEALLPIDLTGVARQGEDLVVQAPGGAITFGAFSEEVP